MTKKKNTDATSQDIAFTSTGQSKVERYKWAKGCGPGYLRWVKKTDLNIPDEYQRRLNEAKTVAIASEFSWPAFGVLIVGERQDGKLFVIAGQHRTAAALRRSDIDDVPCVIFKLTTEQEARAFLTEATHRKPLTAIDKYKAELIVKRPATVLVHKLLTESGRVAVAGGMSPRHVACLGMLTTLADKQPEALTKLWPLISQLTDGVHLQEKHVAPLMYIERFANESLLSPRWTKRVLALGASGVVDAANRAGAYYKHGGAKVWARGVVDALNRNLTEARKLVVKNIDESAEDEEPAQG